MSTGSISPVAQHESNKASSFEVRAEWDPPYCGRLSLIDARFDMQGYNSPAPSVVSFSASQTALSEPLQQSFNFSRGRDIAILPCWPSPNSPSCLDTSSHHAPKNDQDLLKENSTVSYPLD